MIFDGKFKIAALATRTTFDGEYANLGAVEYGATADDIHRERQRLDFDTGESAYLQFYRAEGLYRFPLRILACNIDDTLGY
jgi:hypothetical protein